MSKIQKTFEEDTDLGDVLIWVNDMIYVQTYETHPRDPAEIEVRLAKKIKIIIEIKNKGEVREM